MNTILHVKSALMRFLMIGKILSVNLVSILKEENKKRGDKEMSCIKRLFEDIEVLVKDGADDFDILSIINEKYGLSSDRTLEKDNWLLRQVTQVRDKLGVYD